MVKRALTAALALLFFASCASQTGLFSDTFRGRWWNYYERGAVYVAEGKYEQAQSDFAEAVKGRKRDAWSARTYGLHFAEYFPNRELGVAYYELGQYTEAEAALTESLQAVDTARAHHFLDLVKRAQIASGALSDTDAPTLAAQLPGGGLVTSREVEYTISAQDDTGVSAVRVNGQELYQRGSDTTRTFSNRLRLAEGEHIINIEADDLADKAAAEALTVRVDLTAPTIAVFEPAPELITQGSTIQLRGAAVDQFGVAQVRLGDTVLASASGENSRLDFSTELTLASGDNSFVLVVTDQAGNENRAAVRVYQGEPQSPQAKMWWLHHRAPNRLKLAMTGGPAVISAILDSAFAAAEAPLSIEMSFPDIPDDTEYHRNELPVKGRVLASNTIQSLTIKGKNIPVIADPQEGTGQTSQTFDTRVDLQRGSNSIPVLASDDQGNSAEQDIQIKAEFVMADSPEAKMPVAVLAIGGEAAGDSDAREILRGLFTEQLIQNSRFTLVDRAELQTVLTEQQLSDALGDPTQALELGKIIPAQAFMIGKVAARGAGLEVTVEVLRTETSQIIKVADAYVPDRTQAEAIRNGFNEIATQVSEVYPRRTGRLIAAQGEVLAADFTSADGVFVGMHFLVLRENDDGMMDQTTGEYILPPTVKIIGRAEITQVADSASRGRLIPVEEGEETEPLEANMPTLTW